MAEATLPLGETADEADWRALVDKGLKGASWDKLVGKTSDGIAIQPLYRESDIATAREETGEPPAIFLRSAPLAGWRIRQVFEHPDPEQTNREILADLQGGVAAIELKIDPEGQAGVHIRDAAGLDRALADVILEAAPVSLDAGAATAWAGEVLAAKLKGVAAPGTAFNLDPIGVLMRGGELDAEETARAVRFAQRVRTEMPSATALRVDARPVHEAGGTECQEIAAALATGAFYLRALTEAGMNIGDAAVSMQFAFSVGADVLVEAAKLRAFRLCWERMLEASEAQPIVRGGRIHAFTSKRMMTRYDAQTNILRVTTAAFASAIAGADVITTLPFTDALGLPTAFARRVARNTQLVLLEEARLHHVKDPAGGAWFVEKLTRDLAELAWSKMQAIEAQGGIAAALTSGALQKQVAAARAARAANIARRKETITGVTDFPLLGQKPPGASSPVYGGSGREAADGGNNTSPLSHAARDSSPVNGGAQLIPIRWAEPFETLRAKAEGKAPGVFFANLGPLAEFSARSVFAQNLFAAGGIAAIEPEAAYAARDAIVDAYKKSKSPVAIITGADARYASEAADAARALKSAGASWVLLAGKPGEHEAALRAAGVDQFVFVGQDMLKELETLHAALGVA